ncbi:MAG: GTP cyclohydrolase FolE2 [Caldisericia bacterium]|nr:GTP cyclohydrolase FolE2 [Caldisericia bacterium]
MRDIQSESDYREIHLDRVGVNGVRYPIRIKDRQDTFQHTNALINLYVNLPKEFRGTHMSRFIEILNRYQSDLSYSKLKNILIETKESLKANDAHIEILFAYFILKSSPVSNIQSYMDYTCQFIASQNDRFDFILEVNVPVQLVCPCSKEISRYGAHNQRGNAKIKTRMNGMVWIEELVQIAENAGSSPLFTLLKREDEKYITEHAYDHPKFVEDVVRDIALPLERDKRITWYQIEVLSQESIHNHNAYASVTKKR